MLRCSSGVRCQVSGVRCQVSGVRCQVSGVRMVGNRVWPLCIRNDTRYRFSAHNLKFSMFLIKQVLFFSGNQGARKRGTPLIPVSPIMLMKTNVEKMSLFGLAIMCMKTIHLYVFAIMCMKQKEKAIHANPRSRGIGPCQCFGKLPWRP